LAEGADGAVWIGENDEARVTRINGDDEAVVYGVAEGLPAGRETRIRTAANGTVWVATTGGCAVFDGRRFHAVDPEAGGARRPVLARSRYGGMWASRGGRLIKYDDEGNRLESLGPAWFQDVSQVNALLEDGSGALWIGTLDSGLFCYKGGGFQRVPTSFSDIYCLMEDGEGNVWCGTWGGGLNRISPRRFFMRQVRHGAPGEVVRSMLEDTEKRFWAVGRYGRLVRSAGPEVGSFLPVPLPGTDLRVTTLAPSGPGIWVGTNQGLLRWDKELQSETLVREPVAALLAERNGTVWAGTETGPLLRCTGEKVDSIDSVRSARAMALDQRGRLWVGTEQGQLFTQHGDRFEAVSIPDTQPNRTVRFILPDENDTLWIGVLQGGLYQYRNGRIRKVPDAPKGALRELRCLLIERGAPPATDKPPRSSPDDVFWIGTANGLLRTTRSAIARNRVAKTGTPRDRPQRRCSRRRVFDGLPKRRDPGERRAAVVWNQPRRPRSAGERASPATPGGPGAHRGGGFRRPRLSRTREGRLGDPAKPRCDSNPLHAAGAEHAGTGALPLPAR
jgi:ligand-binding sensor domain-containing protein